MKHSSATDCDFASDTDGSCFGVVYTAGVDDAPAVREETVKKCNSLTTRQRLDNYLERFRVQVVKMLLETFRVQVLKIF